MRTALIRTENKSRPKQHLSAFFYAVSDGDDGA
jgi:hypothetical protein